MTEVHSDERYKKESRRFEAIISDIPRKNVPVFRGPKDKWLATEENVLLMCIQGYGYGNWTKHARILTEQFNKKFTPEEVCDHYNNTYLEGDIAEAMKPAYSKIYRSSRVDHTCTEDDELAKSADVYTYETFSQEDLKEIGYMPLRQQFRVEYENESEEIVSNLSCKTEDEYDKNLALIVLDAYLFVTEYREKVKKIIKEQKLIEQYFASSDYETDGNSLGNNSVDDTEDMLFELFDSNDYSFERQTRSKSKSLSNREIMQHEITSRQSWDVNTATNSSTKSGQIHFFKKRKQVGRDMENFERKAIEGQNALTLQIEQMSKDIEIIKSSISENSKNCKKIVELLTKLNSNLKKTNEKLDVLTEMFSVFIADK